MPGPRTPELFIGKQGTPEFRRQTLRAQEGIYETPTLEGVEVIGGFHRSSVSGWMIAFGVPKTVFTTELHRELTIDIAAAVLVLLLGALLAGSISGQIGRSIRAMTTPALALGSSKEIGVPMVEIREVNELGQALTKASQLIKQRERERDEAAHQKAKIERVTQAITEAGSAWPDGGHYGPRFRKSAHPDPRKPANA